MLGLSVSVQALTDIDLIWRYIARQKPFAADRLVDQLYERFALIQSGPEAGELRHDLATGIRQAIVEP
jgi:plasmid stabilization system protein ParE